MSDADAIVVGSGAAGGWAAKELTAAGCRVLLLEAGPEQRKSSTLAALAARLWHQARGTQAVQTLCYNYWITDPKLFVNDAKLPYTTPADRPFVWIRGRQVGGRTMLWNGVALRMSNYELQAAKQDGYGPAWPIRYRDLAPHYDRVERFLQIHGTREGLPQLPDGVFAGARPLTGAERQLRERVAAVWPERRLIPSRGIAISNRGGAQPGLTSVSTTIAAARATGRLTLRSGAAVSHLVPNRRSGRADGVLYVDAETGASHVARANLIVLCASTIETVRILLTTQEEYPELPVTESDCLGRYLMDHLATGTMIELDDVPYESPGPGTGADAFLIPRFQNLSSREPYLRGFGLRGEIQRQFLAGGRRGPARGVIAAQGEMLPKHENRVELDGGRGSDGLRSVRINCAWGDNDREMHAAMDRTIEEMLSAAGGRTRRMFDRSAGLPGPLGVLGRMERFWRFPPPGTYSHEVGGARMGTDPSSSVVDASNRCWRLPNVLITDGACWPTCGWQAPTLTIMAVTARACTLALEDLRRRELAPA